MDGTDRSEPSGIRRVPLTPDGYDRRWTDLAAAGAAVHGEADLVDGLVRELAETPAGPLLKRKENSPNYRWFSLRP